MTTVSGNILPTVADLSLPHFVREILFVNSFENLEQATLSQATNGYHDKTKAGCFDKLLYCLKVM